MEKEQNKIMSGGNDMSYVEEQTTDAGMKTVLFASNPLQGASAAGIEADVKAFLAFAEKMGR